MARVRLDRGDADADDKVEEVGRSSARLMVDYVTGAAPGQTDGPAPLGGTDFR